MRTGNLAKALLLSAALGAWPSQAKVVVVNSGADGVDNRTSWANAFTRLDRAIGQNPQACTLMEAFPGVVRVGGWQPNTILMENCAVFGSRALDARGLCAVYVEGSGDSLTMRNCTISNGGSQQFEAVRSEGYAHITNSIIWNLSNYSYESETNNGLSVPPTSHVSYSCIKGSPLAGQNSNIRSNSGFVSEADFHLSPSSPCIDAGNGDAALRRDLEGHSRGGSSGNRE